MKSFKGIRIIGLFFTIQQNIGNIQSDEFLLRCQFEKFQEEFENFSICNGKKTSQFFENEVIRVNSHICLTSSNLIYSSTFLHHFRSTVWSYFRYNKISLISKWFVLNLYGSCEVLNENNLEISPGNTSSQNLFFYFVYFDCVYFCLMLASHTIVPN